VAEVFRKGGRHKVDAKGRVSIPSGFRSVIAQRDPERPAGEAPRFVIVFGDPRREFLECYSMDAIAEVNEKISKLKRGSPRRRMLERVYYDGSQTMSVDDTGRIVLPADLRAKIGLDGEAQFVGAGDTFQIWHPDTYGEVEKSHEEMFADLDPDMDIAELLDMDDEE
jgi:MraZ protein